MLRWAYRSFYRRLLLSTGLIVIITTGLVGVAVSRAARRHLTQEMAARLEAQARLLSDGVPAAGVDAWADRQAARTGARVTVIAADGKVLGDSDVAAADLHAVENHSERPEVRDALAGRVGSAVRRSATVDEDFLYLALPLGRGGALRLAMPLSDVRAKVRALRGAVVGACLLCLLGAWLLSLLITRSMHRPIAALAETADRMSRGDFTARAEIDAPDEIGRLGAVMNALAARISDMVAEMSAEKAQLSATLDNMVEAVAVVGADRRVIVLNPVMEQLFGVGSDKIEGRPFAQACRNEELDALLRRTLDRRRGEFQEFKLHRDGKRYFEVYANPIMEGDSLRGAVLVLHEITRMKRLEKVRRDFVANVSHELRTPLASIKGFAETLRLGALNDKENRAGFVATIEEHADRLARLVDDLLGLAAIESDTHTLVKEDVDLPSFVADLLKELGPVAGKRRVALEAEVPAGLALSADRDGLHRALQNVVVNAIKYNREGGRVVVAAARRGDKIEIAVKDTGIGIPAKDLPRLFERFYRVDKARSREMGGTGLGLSIVKHWVENHGGRVWAESVDGQGTTFFLVFPA